MPQPHDLSRWYLAQVKPNCAQIAQRNLERQDFGCFVPLERYTLRRGGRFHSQTRLYFPGYLFVAIRESSAPWSAIRSTQGVARLVSFGTEPEPVPSGIIGELMQNCDAEGYIRPRADMEEGDMVQITNGPLESFMGKVERLVPEERAWVLLDIVGKATRVTLHRGDLRIAS